MPLTPIPNGFGIATVKYSLNASQRTLSTTFGFQNVAGGTALAAATSINAEWVGNFPVAGLDSQATYIGVGVLIDVGGNRFSHEFLQNAAGTRGTRSPSPAVSIGCTKQTLLAGKKFRGRFYLPSPLLEEALVDDGGTIDAGAVAAVQAAMTSLLGDLNTAGYPMALLHHDLSVPQLVSDIEVRNLVRTQRRRQAR